MTDEAHTFMFADISGYSRLTELDGDEAAAEVALSFLAKASGLAPSHRAEVIKCRRRSSFSPCRTALERVRRSSNARLGDL